MTTETENNATGPLAWIRGYPMKREGGRIGFDPIEEKPVYHYRDRYGRKFLAVSERDKYRMRASQ